MNNTMVSGIQSMRAAALKKRFAETILKAEKELLLNQADRIKTKPKPKPKPGTIEAQIIADKAASQNIAQAWKILLERNREAARISLQKMENTVHFEDNLYIGKYFENLRVFGSTKPLEEFGLFLKKDDDLYEDEEEVIDIEEGEIIEWISNENSYHKRVFPPALS